MLQKSIIFQNGVRSGLGPSPQVSPISDFKKSTNLNQKEIKRRLELQLNKLMTTCVIMRIEDFTIYKVTTSGKKQALKEFIAGKRLFIY